MENDRKMIDLGYANGWSEDSIEQRLYDMVHKAGYGFKEVSSLSSGRHTVYECKEAGLRYHVCSD